jgi:hypothetical protein
LLFQCNTNAQNEKDDKERYTDFCALALAEAQVRHLEALVAFHEKALDRARTQQEMMFTGL